MPDNLLRPIDLSLPIAPEHAILDVHGQSSIDAIQRGDFENISAGVGTPVGLGPLNSPATLTVDLGPQAGLTAGFDVTNPALGGVHQTGSDALVRGVFSRAPIDSSVMPMQS